MKIIFLCSGGGGTMKFVHQIQQKSYNNFPIDIVAIVADRECEALTYAKDNSIDNYLHNFKRNDIDNKYLIKILNNYAADIIVTTVHKIISKEVLEQVNSTFVNNHYSILPAFKGFIGMKTAHEALKINSRFLGATCHYVSEEVDAGKIISQTVFPSNENDNIEKLVFISGCLTLLSALLYISGDSIKSTFYETLQTNPGINFSSSHLDSIFNEILVN